MRGLAPRRTFRAVTEISDFGAIVLLVSAGLFLAVLGDHGGPTPTIPPSPLISAAVDVGTITVCSPTDQRGVVRPVAGDSIPGVQCDAGAVEVRHATA